MLVVWLNYTGKAKRSRTDIKPYLSLMNFSLSLSILIV
jgi:hypothetical protein